MPADAAEIVRLAERVEQATGPDRELDAAVWLHLPEQDGHAWKHDGDRYKHARQIAGVSYVPAYTASLDAAMTLVPSGFMWRLQSWPDGVNSALLEKNAGDFGAIDARQTETFAGTPELALTAACLRARAAQHDREVG